MYPVLDSAEAVLRLHPAPAVRLDELARRLRETGQHRGMDPARLEALLIRAPRRFRVLDVWSGPSGRRGAAAPSTRELWVTVARQPDDPPPGGAPAHRLRETVRWLARRVDPRSRRAVSRWYRLVLSEERTRPGLRPVA